VAGVLLAAKPGSFRTSMGRRPVRHARSHHGDAICQIAGFCCKQNASHAECMNSIHKGIHMLVLLLAASLVLAQQDPPAPPITSAREYFAAYGIDFGALRLLVDSRVFDAEEQEPLLKILAQLPRITADEFQAWQKKDIQPEQFVASANDLRAEAMHVKGRAKKIEQVKLSEAIEEKYQLAGYYQIEMEVDSYGPAVVFSREIPALWGKSILGKPIDERVSLWGVYLKFGAPPADEKARPTLYFAAQRLAWLPDRDDPAMKVSPSLHMLGDLGVDVTLLSTAIDQQPLRSEEREAFYQLLNAAAKADPTKLSTLAAARSSLAPLLAQPKEMRGELVTVEGIVHRATKIIVDDADIKKRFGLDHYFELVIFVPERIRYRQGQDGPEVLYDSFPVVCCVARLPAEIKVDEDLSEKVRISGFYFKLYSYSSQFMQQQLKERNLPGELRQHSPLILAPTAVFIPRPKAEENSFAGPLAFFVVTLVVVGAIWGFLQLRGTTAADMRPATRIAPPEGSDEPPTEDGMPQIKSRPPNL